MTSRSAANVPAEQRQNTDARTSGSLSSKLNWLRAGVLGANDGICSTAGVLMGVAGATSNNATILVAGTAALVAGALSMAGGEYVSVSSQRDTEKAELAQEAQELRDMPVQELTELTEIYKSKGLADELARQVAVQLTQHDALAAHAEAELGIRAHETSNPWHAALASMIAFTVGGLAPLLLMGLPKLGLNVHYRILVTLVGVSLALMLTGVASAHLGGGDKWRPALRNVTVGALSMLLTYGVGRLFGTH